MRIIIIDDEPLARSLLKDFLSSEKDIEIVGEYDNGFDGLKGIAALQPDLLLLDVQMPKLNGFEMLELMDESPQIIFTTAYDAYAVKAFENNAVDYLLKPFSKERLHDALAKGRAAMAHAKGEGNRQKLIDLRDRENEVLTRIAVKTGNKINIIYPPQIQYLESQDDYVMIYTSEGKYLKQKTMKFFENHLPAEQFVRVHRSYIVRVDFVNQIELYNKDGYIIKLKNGMTVPVSKSGYTRLRNTLHF